MSVVDGIDALPASLRFVATLGVFDGVHRGHCAVLRATAAAASTLAARTVAITFEPHPETVLRGRTPPVLCDPQERLARFEHAGVELCVIQRFDRDFAAQSPEAFLRRLARGRELAGFVMTPESAFGRDREGTLHATSELSGVMHFRLVRVESLILGGSPVSSSRIRAEIEAGRLAAAHRLLGRNYAVIGSVVHGDGRGRQLGYPTANLAFDAPVTLPPDGVYAVRVSWGGPGPLQPRRNVEGVASLGVRPMFNGHDRVLEVHLLDFDEDLYGERLRVAFVRRQRGQRRFTSVPALVRQMDRDAERAGALLRLPEIAGSASSC